MATTSNLPFEVQPDQIGPDMKNHVAFAYVTVRDPNGNFPPIQVRVPNNKDNTNIHVDPFSFVNTLGDAVKMFMDEYCGTNEPRRSCQQVHLFKDKQGGLHETTMEEVAVSGVPYDTDEDEEMDYVGIKPREHNTIELEIEISGGCLTGVTKTGGPEDIDFEYTLIDHDDLEAEADEAEEEDVED